MEKDTRYLNLVQRFDTKTLNCLLYQIVFVLTKILKKTAIEWN